MSGWVVLALGVWVWLALLVFGLLLFRGARKQKQEEPVGRQMRVDCAWCGERMKEGLEPVSHGICPDCLMAMKSEEGLR